MQESQNNAVQVKLLSLEARELTGNHATALDMKSFYLTGTDVNWHLKDGFFNLCFRQVTAAEEKSFKVFSIPYGHVLLDDKKKIVVVSFPVAKMACHFSGTNEIVDGLLPVCISATYDESVDAMAISFARGDGQDRCTPTDDYSVIVETKRRRVILVEILDASKNTAMKIVR